MDYRLSIECGVFERLAGCMRGPTARLSAWGACTRHARKWMNTRWRIAFSDPRSLPGIFAGRRF